MLYRDCLFMYVLKWKIIIIAYIVHYIYLYSHW